jgi:hypothetical protein
MSNATTLFRSLLIYGLCLPLAVFLGYLLAEPMDFSTVTVVVITLSVLTIPLLLRWHHAWLIATWNMTAMLFFLPGKPAVWMGLAAASFTICILQYALNRKMTFLHAPSVARPLLFLLVVILLTAHATGGIGFRILGGDTYGGKRYFAIVAAMLGYFAIINRRIPPKRASLYVTLFFAGTATMAIAELPGRVSPALNFLFVFFPVASMGAFTNQNSVVGQIPLMSHMGGLAFLSLGFFCAMLARYGIRGILDTTKPSRLVAFCFFVLVGLSSGFRSVLVLVLMTFALLFYLERLHHTRLLLPVISVSLAVGGLALLFAARLPLDFQRTLAVLPYIQLDPLARMSAEVSSEWRVQIWQEVIPQIPRYLLIGKGYSFSGTEQGQMGSDNVASTELAGDYHNGPLSVILPFGIFGSIAFIWLLVAGIRVVYHNYRFGDPAYHNINTFLFAYFVVKVIFFFTVFGALAVDLPMFLGLLGLSISVNGGVAKPVFVPQPKIVFNRFKLHPSAHRPVGA